MIVTGNIFFYDHASSPAGSFAEYVLRYLRRASMHSGVTLRGLEISDHAPLKAWVSAGRWIVLCGSATCKGAERVWEEGLVMCASCWNGYAGHQLVRTSFPRSRRRIEEQLDVRPLENRNWLLGETVADLEIENAQHAAELLVGQES